MIFIDWHRLCLIALPLALAGLCVLLMWQARRKPLWARILVATLATLLAVASAGPAIFLTAIAMATRQMASMPIYSPNRNLAARVETWEGILATDNGTNVKIYSLHGFRSAFAYGGDEQSVAPENVRWIDDHTLEVRYSYEDEHTCDSTPEIRVICLPLSASRP